MVPAASNLLKAARVVDEKAARTDGA